MKGKKESLLAGRKGVWEGKEEERECLHADYDGTMSLQVGDLGIAKLVKDGVARTQIGTPHCEPLLTSVHISIVPAYCITVKWAEYHCEVLTSKDCGPKSSKRAWFCRCSHAA